MPKDPRATEEIAQKVRYERGMLDWCAQQIALASELPKSDANQSRSNLTLEGFLLHARVLRDFFVGPPKKDDDVLAEHFLEEPVPVCTWSCPYLSEHRNRKRLDKLLAHLTYTRLGHEKKWNVAKIHAEIERAWQEFLGALPVGTQQWFALSTPSPNLSGVALVCTTSSGGWEHVPGKLG